MRSCFTIAMLAALAAGCVAGGEGGYSVAYAAPSPDLMYVAPGVQVIADYDYLVFSPASGSVRWPAIASEYRNSPELTRWGSSWGSSWRRSGNAAAGGACSGAPGLP